MTHPTPSLPRLLPPEVGPTPTPSLPIGRPRWPRSVRFTSAALFRPVPPCSAGRWPVWGGGRRAGRAVWHGVAGGDGWGESAEGWAYRNPVGDLAGSRWELGRVAIWLRVVLMPSVMP